MKSRSTSFENALKMLTFMSNNNCLKNKLTIEKDSYFVTSKESSEPKENLEKQILTDTKPPTTPQKTQLQI